MSPWIVVDAVALDKDWGVSLSAYGEIWCPPVGNSLSAYGEFLLSAVTAEAHRPE